MSEETPRSLWSRVRWIVWILWIVAAIKLGLEFREAEDPIAFEFAGIRWQGSIGVYYVSFVLLVVAAIRGTFDGLRYGKLALSALLLAVLGWCVPNTVTYTTAQFQGWTHGRFQPPVSPEEAARLEAAGEVVPKERSAPIAATPAGKLGTGLLVGLMTTIAGFLWTFLWIHLLVVLPRRFGRPRGASA